MTHQRHDDRRDENEAAIVHALEERGDFVVRLGRGAGADLLIMNKTGLHIAEVKNPKKEWKYTESELERREVCAILGIEYHLLFRPSDIAEIPNEQ